MQNIQLIDLPGLDQSQPHSHGLVPYLLLEQFAFFRSQLFGIVEPWNDHIGWKYHSSGHHWSGQATATNLIYSGNPLSSNCPETPLQLEQTLQALFFGFLARKASTMPNGQTANADPFIQFEQTLERLI